MKKGIVISKVLASLLIVTALLALSPCGKAQGKLPSQTQSLLQKLSEWEVREKATLDKSIQKKRDEIALILKQHLKEATQAGDLKTANLIQSEIDNLGSSKPIALRDEKKAPKPRRDREIKTIIMNE